MGLHSRLVGTWLGLEAWVENHPRRAWTLALLFVLGVVGCEVAYWPLRDYPGSMWHATPRGLDVEIVQERAAVAGWKEIAGYWTGRVIQGNAYWEPLTSALFVAEYRLFGRNDRLWQLPSLALHLGVALMLVWTGARIAEGSRLRRLGTGVLAALLLGAPGLADRSVETWILGWWPAQSEMLSLLFSLPMLAGSVEYARRGERKWLFRVPLLFFLAICFKENGYIAAVVACLILLRRRRGWPLLALMVLCGLLFFAYRLWAIRALGLGAGSNPARMLRMTQGWGDFSGSYPLQVNLALLGAALLLGRALRKRWPLRDRVGLGLALYFGVGSLLLGPPWDGFFRDGVRQVVLLASSLALLFGLGLALRRWPAPELLLLCVMTAASALCFPPILAWHRYWNEVFRSLLVALALVELAVFAACRLRTREWAAPAARPPAEGVPAAG